ncbi:MAG: chlorophyll synthesis pathway protein BchC [Gammaproteobacteria bacterium]|nr:chlorophyll synthesis pathway protein BchC [Gammaproteobacteria bacterium]
MQARAVVLEEPRNVVVTTLELERPAATDLVVDVAYSGISTGTERLLFTGEMPPFPGLGYPLVPGYESVGVVAEAGNDTALPVGSTVFVPGAACFGEIRGLFGATASRLVVPARRAIPIDAALGEHGILLALAATAYHAIAAVGSEPPDLIVGHGVLGRLLARLTLAKWQVAPVVWEVDAGRSHGAMGYEVIHPDDDTQRTYRSIYEASGAGDQLDKLIGRLSPGGEIVLAGFYRQPLSFNFPPAFMREASLKIAAEFQPDDLIAVKRLVESGLLPLEGLITHRNPADAATSAYETAFTDTSCLKMVLDWRASQ